MYKWITVTERLPKENERCLIFPIDGEAESAVYFKDGKWIMWDFIVGVDTVTHWLPLPKPNSDCERPECYNPNSNPYPLCKGANTPQGVAENECYTCCLYEDYVGDGYGL